MTERDPWRAGQATAGGHPSPGSPPPVLAWYRAFCGVTALLYGFIVLAGGFLLFGPFSFFEKVETGDAALLAFQGTVMISIGAAGAIVHVVPFFLTPSRAAWIFGIVLIGLSLTSCCYWPASIPLLLFWVKPENRSYFQA